MSFTKALDVSRWQGIIDWQQVKNAGAEIAVIKMSGGDDGLYIDPRANANYYGAQAAGLAIGMYHFAGGTDPIAEADFFLNACSPLAEGDVLILDWEVQNPDPVGWCNTFMKRIHDKCGVWPMIYMNGSTWNAYNWSPVTDNCGVYVAWYGRNPDDTLPVPGVYVMHQYTSTGGMPGISGNVDLDAWFGSVDQFKAYGYHAPQAPAQTPAPAPAPAAPTPVEVAHTETPAVNVPVTIVPPAPGTVVEPDVKPTAPVPNNQPKDVKIVPQPVTVVVVHHTFWYWLITQLTSLFKSHK